MHIVQQILFVLISAVAIFLFARKVQQIRANILLGRDEDLSDQPGRRWRNMILLALGQQKMFRNPLVAVLHLLVFLNLL